MHYISYEPGVPHVITERKLYRLYLIARQPEDTYSGWKREMLKMGIIYKQF